MLTTEQTEEYQEGLRAFLDGWELNDCPYSAMQQPTRTQRWESGWFDGQDRAEEELTRNQGYERISEHTSLEGRSGW